LPPGSRWTSSRGNGRASLARSETSVVMVLHPLLLLRIAFDQA
jgi:hypothetical protein